MIGVDGLGRALRQPNQHPLLGPRHQTPLHPVGDLKLRPPQFREHPGFACSENSTSGAPIFACLLSLLGCLRATLPGKAPPANAPAVNRERNRRSSVKRLQSNEMQSCSLRRRWGWWRASGGIRNRARRKVFWPKPHNRRASEDEILGAFAARDQAVSGAEIRCRLEPLVPGT